MGTFAMRISKEQDMRLSYLRHKRGVNKKIYEKLLKKIKHLIEITTDSMPANYYEVMKAKGELCKEEQQLYYMLNDFKNLVKKYESKKQG